MSKYYVQFKVNVVNLYVVFIYGTEFGMITMLRILQLNMLK